MKNNITKTERTHSQTRSPQELAKQAGENIRLRREKMGLSHEGLAKSACVEVKKLIQYENGALMQDLINICRIAEKLKCSPDQLVTYTSKRTKRAIGLALDIEKEEQAEKKEKKENKEAKRQGHNIRETRLALNMSQAQLAENAGVSVKTISKYECGKCIGKLTILNEIARSLGTTRDKLLDGECPESGKKRAPRGQNVA